MVLYMSDSENFTKIYEDTQDYGRVQFVKKIEELEDQIMYLEEDLCNCQNELETYMGYEQEIDDIMQDIGDFMFKLKLDKCYTKELEEFIKNYGGDLFN